MGNTRTVKSQSGLGCKEHKDPLIPSPAMSRDTFHEPSLLQALSNLGDPRATASLGDKSTANPLWMLLLVSPTGLQAGKEGRTRTEHKQLQARGRVRTRLAQKVETPGMCWSSSCFQGSAVPWLCPGCREGHPAPLAHPWGFCRLLQGFGRGALIQGWAPCAPAAPAMTELL